MTVDALQLFNLSNAQVERQPFPHFRIVGAIEAEAASAFLSWLQEHGPWKTVEGGFYAIAQFRVTPERVPPEFGWVVAPSTLQYLRGVMASAFGVAVGARVDVDAHYLAPGQRIGIHNDYRPGAETHRLVVTLADAWDCDDGGFLVLLRGPRPEDAELIIPPVGGSVVGFEISPGSFHAVTPVTRGCRVTLLYSFYGPEQTGQTLTRGLAE